MLLPHFAIVVNNMSVTLWKAVIGGGKSSMMIFPVFHQKLKSKTPHEDEFFFFKVKVYFWQRENKISNICVYQNDRPGLCNITTISSILYLILPYINSSEYTGKISSMLAWCHSMLAPG